MFCRSCLFFCYFYFGPILSVLLQFTASDYPLVHVSSNSLMIKCLIWESFSSLRQNILLFYFPCHVLLIICVERQYQQYFTFHVGVSFIGGRNRGTRRNVLTYKNPLKTFSHKSVTTIPWFFIKLPCLTSLEWKDIIIQCTHKLLLSQVLFESKTNRKQKHNYTI